MIVAAGTVHNLLVSSPLKILRIIGEKPVLTVCRRVFMHIKKHTQPQRHCKFGKMDLIHK